MSPRYRLLGNGREPRAGALPAREASPPACLFTLGGASLSVEQAHFSYLRLKIITKSERLFFFLDCWSAVYPRNANYEDTGEEQVM